MSGGIRRATTRGWLRRPVAIAAALALCGTAGICIRSAVAQGDKAKARSKGKGKAKKDKDKDKAAQQAGSARFIHSDHADNGLKIDECEKCHTLEDNWNTAPPTMGKNHQPCNNSGCHFDDFFAAKPVICTVCHANSEPWVKQRPLIQARGESEFGAGSFNHKSHLKITGGGKASNKVCKSCHGDKFKTDEGPKAQSGHSNCAGCHGKTAEPAMGNCGDCHVRGKKARALAANKWSVADLFTHTTHGRDTRKGRETQCTLCHKTIAKATTLDKRVYPLMKDCDVCHNGKTAFKTTGFECYKCHGSATE